jgi:hypothetical protein
VFKFSALNEKVLKLGWQTSDLADGQSHDGDMMNPSFTEMRIRRLRIFMVHMLVCRLIGGQRGEESSMKIGSQWYSAYQKSLFFFFFFIFFFRRVSFRCFWVGPTTAHTQQMFSPFRSVFDKLTSLFRKYGYTGLATLAAVDEKKKKKKTGFAQTVVALLLLRGIY